MCVVQIFTNVYPDGVRKLSDRLVYCPLGTPGAPCNEKRVIHTNEEHYIQWPRPPFPHPIPAVRSESPKGGDTKKKEKPAAVMCFVDFHIPGTSRREPRPGRPGVPIRRPSQSSVRPNLPPPPRPAPPAPPTPPTSPRRAPMITPWDPHDEGYVRPRMHRRTRPRSPSPDRRPSRDRRSSPDCRRNLRRLARERDLRHWAEDDAREAQERQIQAERDAELLRRENDHVRECIIEQERRDERRRRQEEDEEARLYRIERERRQRLGRGVRREVLLHQRGRAGFEMERGNRIIPGAIRDERMGWDEEGALHAEPFRRARNPNILGRRRTIGGGRERVIYEDEQTRPRWRWI